MLVNGQPYRTVWMEGGIVKLIEQRLLPHRFEILSCHTCQETAFAIQDMAVRGAGAIGAAAGYAMAQAVLKAPESSFRAALEEGARAIRATRPTAHDLFVAVERVLEAAVAAPTVAAARQAAVSAAGALADDNAKAGEAIGRVGAGLLHAGMRILTHCNAGWLAFVDWGSALAPIYSAHRAGVALFVYVTETRPRSQGAKLTDWELAQAGVPHVLIADTAAGSLLRQGKIDGVIVGADRIAANGDVANKIGTYSLAVLARAHQVPFYVAAPRSTFDPSAPDGDAIPIETRHEDEVLSVSGLADDGTLKRVRIAAAASHALNPAFDITPASLVTRFITEAGLLEPEGRAIAAFVQAPHEILSRIA
ncbi:MAG: S-methyl-5-thioribose-1-phosphate isomerase [Candidatus Omnitrophota bacterium]|nr:S-methyl-5-thioribose-1-phosphate isomerase [Candidatus Omnitrophota bacterium]